ncbi:hypothetical protein [Nonomuraea fuscirosea]|uniref:hypothetical protein n=1 Tax=Nonomuraea fuscirosea TaxID=1291556 RepID=UPI003428C29A
MLGHGVASGTTTYAITIARPWHDRESGHDHLFTHDREPAHDRTPKQDGTAYDRAGATAAAPVPRWSSGARASGGDSLG